MKNISIETPQLFALYFQCQVVTRFGKVIFHTDDAKKSGIYNGMDPHLVKKIAPTLSIVDIGEQEAQKLFTFIETHLPERIHADFSGCLKLWLQGEPAEIEHAIANMLAHLGHFPTSTIHSDSLLVQNIRPSNALWVPMAMFQSTKQALIFLCKKLHSRGQTCQKALVYSPSSSFPNAQSVPFKPTNNPFVIVQQLGDLAKQPSMHIVLTHLAFGTPQIDFVQNTREIQALWENTLGLTTPQGLPAIV